MTFPDIPFAKRIFQGRYRAADRIQHRRFHDRAAAFGAEHRGQSHAGSARLLAAHRKERKHQSVHGQGGHRHGRADRHSLRSSRKNWMFLSIGSNW